MSKFLSSKISPLFANLGFRRRSGLIFTMELKNNMLGWLGLNTATKHQKPGNVEINPVIGIRNQKIEKLVAELDGRKYHKYIPPTVGISLGYLMPEKKYRSWLLQLDDSDQAVNNLVAAVKVYGIDFIRKNSSLKSLSKLLETDIGYEFQNMCRYPVSLFMLGDIAKAKKVLDKSLLEIANRNDMAAKDFRRFAKKFQKHLRFSV